MRVDKGFIDKLDEKTGISWQNSNIPLHILGTAKLNCNVYTNIVLLM